MSTIECLPTEIINYIFTLLIRAKYHIAFNETSKIFNKISTMRARISYMKTKILLPTIKATSSIENLSISQAKFWFKLSEQMCADSQCKGTLTGLQYAYNRKKIKSRCLGLTTFYWRKSLNNIDVKINAKQCDSITRIVPYCMKCMYIHMNIGSNNNNNNNNNNNIPFANIKGYYNGSNWDYSY